MHPISGYIERTPSSAPPYDANAHQAALYTHRKAIATLRSGWGTTCTGCTREEVQQVVDFHPVTGQPRGLLCRECRHLTRWQVWEDGLLVAWLEPISASDMQCRLACTCRLLHAHDTEEEAAECGAKITQWGRLANYLAATEPPPAPGEPYVVMAREKSGTGDQAPIPLFMSPGD